MYRRLEARKIVETADRLQHRIRERFPDSGLSKVAMELGKIAHEAEARSARLQRTNVPMRLVFLLVLVLFGGLVYVVGRLIEWKSLEEHSRDVLDFVQMVESSIASVVFLGAALIFVWTLENRMKRHRALEAIYELRSLAHVVDMHQLTKDPERVVGNGAGTASSPERKMTPFELGRYLDYCTELLSLISKIAVVYVQGLKDGEVLDAVDQIETLTTGLSRKIWQKITLLDRHKTRDVAKSAESAG